MAANWGFTWAAVAIGALIAAGCNQTMTKREDGGPALIEGYTCCNFHYEADWISDSNYAQLPMIPAGTPAKVTGFGRYRAYVELDGKPMRLGLDYGREQETTEQWVAKLIVPKDPKAAIAGYPPAVRSAIAQGKVMVGMTKEQVIASLGYPLTNENRSLDAPIWRYWYSSFGEYHLHWDAKGRVEGITADPLTRNLVEYRGK